jgi:hypothetical protein
MPLRLALEHKMKNTMSERFAERPIADDLQSAEEPLASQ